MHLVELRCSKRFIEAYYTVIISLRAVQTTMDNINEYDWDCHIHNIVI